MSQLTKVSFTNVTNFPHANVEANAALAVGIKTGLLDGTESTVATLAANGPRFITQIICSGHVHAEWKIYINSGFIAGLNEDKYTSEFRFEKPYFLNTSEVLDVKVRHEFTGESIDFTATIIGFEKEQ